MKREFFIWFLLWVNCVACLAAAAGGLWVLPEKKHRNCDGFRLPPQMPAKGWGCNNNIFVNCVIWHNRPLGFFYGTTRSHSTREFLLINEQSQQHSSLFHRKQTGLKLWKWYWVTCKKNICSGLQKSAHFATKQPQASMCCTGNIQYML